MMKKKKVSSCDKGAFGSNSLFECVHFIIQEIISLGEFWDRMEDSVQITLSERYVFVLVRLIVDPALLLQLWLQLEYYCDEELFFLSVLI